LSGGVRTTEIGSLMFEHTDLVTGAPIFAPLELLRFAIPRQVYTRSHLDYIGESAAKCMREAEKIRGMKITWAPKVLRHFMAKLEPVD
jgi:tryptophanase